MHRANAPPSRSATDGSRARPIPARKARRKDANHEMKQLRSTHLFVNRRLTGAMPSRIQQAGIPAVEIFCARQLLDYHNKAQVAEIGHWFRDSELKLHSMHSPMY